MSKWKEAREAELKQQQEAEEKVTLEETENAFNEITEESELLRKFKERHEKEAERVKNVTDSRYYFVVCFSNNAQLEEFCQRYDIKPNQLYVDGRELSRKIGRALKQPDTVFHKYNTGSEDYRKRAQKIT